MHILRYLRCCRPSGADGPNRLVGHDDTGQIRGCQTMKSTSQLPRDNLHLNAALFLFQTFSDANYDLQPSSQGRLHFKTNDRVSFAVELTPLRMSNDHVAGAHVSQHKRGNFTGLSSLFGNRRTVLPSEANVGTL